MSDYRDIQFDNKDIIKALQGLSDAATDLKPFFGGFGEYLQLSHDDRWDKEQAPDGTAWADLKPETWANKKGSKKLRERNHMLGVRGSTYDASSDQLLFGMSDEKAPWHHFGTQNRSGNNLIPARPLIGLSEDDKEEFIEQAKEFLENASKVR